MTFFDERGIKKIYEGGKTNSITGDKGGGKSHLAVLHMHILKQLEVIIFTNILFKKVIGFDEKGRKKYVECYPDGIYKVKSIADLLKQMCKHLENHPYSTFVFFWDEFQNSVSAYDWNSEFFKVLIRFFSISRKFGQDDETTGKNGGLCVTVMSPSLCGGIPKRIREELANAFVKDEEMYLKFMQTNPDGIQFSNKEICFFKSGKRRILNENDFGEILKIGSCKLCDEKNAKVGDIVYAQKSHGFLDLGYLDNGKELNLETFKRLLEHSSNTLDSKMPGVILDFLKGKMNKCLECGNETPNPKFCCDACRQKYNYHKKKKNGKKR